MNSLFLFLYHSNCRDVENALLNKNIQGNICKPEATLLINKNSSGVSLPHSSFAYYIRLYFIIRPLIVILTVAFNDLLDRKYLCPHKALCTLSAVEKSGDFL